MKKYLSFLLLFATLVLFAGCQSTSSDKPNTDPSNVTDSTNATAPSSATQPVEIIETTGKANIPYHPSGFDGDKLYVNIDGNTLVYERHAAGIGSLTKKTVLDTFYTATKIEGIVWNVYSAEEHPDLSYVLVISGTNSSWTYRISNSTDTTSAITSVDQIYNKFGHIEYACDLSVFPIDDIRNWFGEIILVEDGKLLVTPGLDSGKSEFGKVVWLIFDGADAYSVGQVVTYTFCDVKAPDKEGAPLNIIALSVYME